jgi:hypothetical protein
MSDIVVRERAYVTRERLDVGAYLSDDGLLDHIQIIKKFLRVGQSPYVVYGFDFAVGRPDENELEPESVFPPHDFLFVGIVVAGRAEMAENHLGDPHIVLWVQRHIDAVPVVLKDNAAVPPLFLFYLFSSLFRVVRSLLILLLVVVLVSLSVSV